MTHWSSTNSCESVQVSRQCMDMEDRSSLQKACLACAKAKRPCDQRLPKCSRCMRLQKECSYVNEPLQPRADPPAQTQDTPKHESATPASHSATIDKGFAKQHFQNDLGTYQIASYYVLMSLGKPTLQFVKTYLRQMANTFAETSKTPFLHPQLYQDKLPLVLQQAHQTCGRSSCSPSNLKKPIWSILEFHQSATSIAEKLATLQALVLLLSVLFASEDPALWQLGQSLMGLTTNLVVYLWSEVPQHLPSSMDPWTAWAFAESVRRTLLMASCMIDVCGELNCGYYKLTVFLASLPFDSSTTLWDVDSKNDWISIRRGTQQLVSYNEFTTGWEVGNRRVQTVFEGFLLAACKGAEFPTLLTSGYAWLDVCNSETCLA